MIDRAPDSQRAPDRGALAVTTVVIEGVWCLEALRPPEVPLIDRKA